MKKLFVLILLFSSFAAFAQKGSSSSAPTSSNTGKYGRALDTWGMGAKLESGVGNFGLDFGYAINRSMSIGADFGFAYVGSKTTAGIVQAGDESFVGYSLAPYVKYYLDPTTSNIFPFIKAQVAIGKNGANSNYTLFRALAGAEWYPISTFAIGGGLSFLEYNTDNSQFQFGTLYPMLNLMWWM